MIATLPHFVTPSNTLLHNLPTLWVKGTTRWSTMPTNGREKRHIRSNMVQQLHKGIHAQHKVIHMQRKLGISAREG